MFGLNYDNATTTFRDIQRLHPRIPWKCLRAACAQHVTGDHRRKVASATRTTTIILIASTAVKQAVSDRLGSESAGIFLSGGLDSGAVAVTAKEIVSSRGGQPNLRSYTMGYDSLIPDDEVVYARKTAEYLGITNKYLALDDVQLFEKWDNARYRFPEPVDDPLSAGLFKQFEMVAADCRVVLSGEGADNLMYFQMWPYLQDLRRTGDHTRLLKEAAWFLWVRPLPWRGAAQRLRSIFTRATGGGGIPDWISPEFAKRTGLEERWKEFNSLFFPEQRHPSRPKAHASMLIPQWTSMFEGTDPGITRAAVEVRYPFLDLRLIDYLLGIPAFPWTYKKRLARKALTGRLPEEVLLRPKTPIYDDPVARQLKRLTHAATLPKWDPRLLEFVNLSGLQPYCGTMDRENIRPYCLNVWLAGS